MHHFTHLLPPLPMLLLSKLLQVPPGKIDQLASAMSYIGIPFVSSMQGCLIQKQSYEQDQHLGSTKHKTIYKNNFAHRIHYWLKISL